MSNELLHQYQRKLIFACLDDFSGSSVMGAYGGGQDGANPSLWWQASVDFLYRNLYCKLIEVNPIHKDFPVGNSKSLCELFASKKPSDELFWFYVQFNGTPLLTNIVKKHGLLDWTHFNGSLNVNFMLEIEKIYLINKVAFSVTPLIPVVE
jgi:hypothetical protein